MFPSITLHGWTSSWQTGNRLLGEKSEVGSKTDLSPKPKRFRHGRRLPSEQAKCVRFPHVDLALWVFVGDGTGAPLPVLTQVL